MGAKKHMKTVDTYNPRPMGAPTKKDVILSWMEDINAGRAIRVEKKGRRKVPEVSLMTIYKYADRYDLGKLSIDNLEDCLMVYKRDLIKS